MTYYYQLAGLYGPEAILSVLGVPVTSSPVTVYQNGTTTVAAIYTDSNKGTPAFNPVTTDGYGNLAFYAEPGLYDLAFSVGGVATTKTVLVSPFTGDAGVPSGVIMAYSANTAPIGWWVCDGREIPRSYTNLFAVIGTLWGPGNGTTTFNIPDLRGRSIVGVGGPGANDQPALPFASHGGEWAHTLSVNELATHGHQITNAGAQLVTDSPGSVDHLPWDSGSWGASLTLVNENTASVGTNSPHNNMHPYAVASHIIKA